MTPAAKTSTVTVCARSHDDDQQVANYGGGRFDGTDGGDRVTCAAVIRLGQRAERVLQKSEKEKESGNGEQRRAVARSKTTAVGVVRRGQVTAAKRGRDGKKKLLRNRSGSAAPRMHCAAAATWFRAKA